MRVYSFSFCRISLLSLWCHHFICYERSIYSRGSFRDLILVQYFDLLSLDCISILPLFYSPFLSSILIDGATSTRCHPAPLWLTSFVPFSISSFPLPLNSCLLLICRLRIELTGTQLTQTTRRQQYASNLPTALSLRRHSPRQTRSALCTRS